VLCYRDGRPIDGNRDRTLADFEQMLNHTFDSQANQYNLYFSYWNTSDKRETRLVSQESDTQPPSTAAVATTSITITDDMNRHIGDECEPIPVTVTEDDDFYINRDVDSESALYNVVEVRLVAW